VAVAGVFAGSYGLLAAPGCDENGSSREGAKTDPTTLMSDAGPFTRSTLLASMGQCALDTYGRAAGKATGLVAAARRHETEQSVASRAAARAAFAETMAEYQQAELMQFGPFGPKTVPGGEGLRDLVYAWPNTNRCLIDETLVAKGFEAGDFVAKGFVSVRGFAALVYLLFAD
jgi:predicted lipoprotein